MISTCKAKRSMLIDKINHADDALRCMMIDRYADRWSYDSHTKRVIDEVNVDYNGRQKKLGENGDNRTEEKYRLLVRENEELKRKLKRAIVVLS